MHNQLICWVWTHSWSSSWALPVHKGVQNPITCPSLFPFPFLVEPHLLKVTYWLDKSTCLHVWMRANVCIHEGRVWEKKRGFLGSVYIIMSESQRIVTQQQLHENQVFRSPHVNMVGSGKKKKTKNLVCSMGQVWIQKLDNLDRTRSVQI